MKGKITATFFAVFLLVGTPFVADAHRSGCHRWHSCPSDTGSYVCGDTGYTSGCPTSTYTQTTKVAPPKNRPANSYVLGSSWYCNDGYKKVGNTCEKVKNPANSYVLGPNWYCNDGYKKVGSACEKVKNPPNSYVLGPNWYCNDGYKKEGSSCVVVVHPPHSYVIGGAWYCEYGYKKVSNQCVSLGN
jgi:hypothetical protein